jgi:hypothetical protein
VDHEAAGHAGLLGNAGKGEELIDGSIAAFGDRISQEDNGLLPLLVDLDNGRSPQGPFGLVFLGLFDFLGPNRWDNEQNSQQSESREGLHGKDLEDRRMAGTGLASWIIGVQSSKAFLYEVLSSGESCSTSPETFGGVHSWRGHPSVATPGGE